MCAGLVMRRLCAAATYSLTLPEIEKAYVVADLGSGNPISGCSVPANNSTARRSYQATISLAAVFPQATLSPELFRQTDGETSSWRGGPRGVAPALATLSYAAIDDLGSHI